MQIIHAADVLGILNIYLIDIICGLREYGIVETSFLHN